ncbi:MAG: prepilin-type N-terminal cleavage/methylation domain-containing protein [bacterium]|nr:prepilin-type N-terminal cleavage/methylation domain-containing protein [bacterium]
MNQKNNGFTIIELIITISILSFGIIGVYSVFSATVNLTNNASQKFIAAYLAQEAFEVVRNIRDTNFIESAPWSDGLLGCENGCQLDYKTVNELEIYNPNAFLNVDPDGFYSYEGTTATRFKRKINITEDPGIDTLKVAIVVSWDYNGQIFDFETGGYLYNWH